MSRSPAWTLIPRFCSKTDPPVGARWENDLLHLARPRCRRTPLRPHHHSGSRQNRRRRYDGRVAPQSGQLDPRRYLHAADSRRRLGAATSAIPRADEITDGRRFSADRVAQWSCLDDASAPWASMPNNFLSCSAFRSGSTFAVRRRRLMAGGSSDNPLKGSLTLYGASQSASCDPRIYSSGRSIRPRHHGLQYAVSVDDHARRLWRNARGRRRHTRGRLAADQFAHYGSAAGEHDHSHLDVRLALFLVRRSQAYLRAALRLVHAGLLACALLAGVFVCGVVARAIRHCCDYSARRDSAPRSTRFKSRS